MPKSDVMLSVSNVCAMQAGDEQNGAWINPGVAGVVNQITKRQSKAGKPFWVIVLGDVNAPDMIEFSMFTAPKFKEGDLIDIHGKGLRRTDYNGKPQMAIGKDTQIDVSGGRQPVAPPPAARPANSRPVNDSRGSDSHPDLEPLVPSGKGANGFHPMMQSFALLYLHALAYARKINTTLKADGHPVMSEGQFQACVSTLYINADRAGLSMNLPPINPRPAATPTAAPPPPPRAAVTAPDDGEDVPF